MKKISIILLLIGAYLMYRCWFVNKEDFFELETDYKVYNQNFNKKWLNFPVGKGATHVQRIFEDGEQAPKTRELNLPYVDLEELASVIKNFIPRNVPQYTYKKSVYSVENNPLPLVTVTPNMLPSMHVMNNRPDDDDKTKPHSYENSVVQNFTFDNTIGSSGSIETLENFKKSELIADAFVKKLNDVWKNSKVKEKIESNSVDTYWQLYQHKLLPIKFNNKNVLATQVTVGLKFGNRGFTINDYRYTVYVVGTVSGKTVNYLSFDMMSFNTTDKDIIQPGYPVAGLYSSDTLHNDPMLSNPKLIKKPKKIHFTKPMPLCFEYKPGNNKYVNNSDLTQNVMTQYRYPVNCESKYGIYYRPKPAGHWSVPCKKNSDCPFYKGNKNYPNKFGGCKADGYCQMPLNVKPLGYRGYYEEQKPMCYNCKNDAWFPISRLDTCCDEQKNNPKKYPFLKGPDYAFQNDKTVRFNKFFQDH